MKLMLKGMLLKSLASLFVLLSSVSIFSIASVPTEPVNAVAPPLSCYDPDIPGYVCTGVSYIELPNGFVAIQATNNHPELPGVLFDLQRGINTEVGGLEYRSGAVGASVVDIIRIDDPCNAGSATWEATDQLGTQISVVTLSIGNPGINIDAQQLCEEQQTGDELAFDVDVIVELTDPASSELRFDFFLEIRLNGTVIQTRQFNPVAIAEGSTTGFESVYVDDPGLVNGQTYEICLIGSESDMCDDVTKTSNVQQHTFTLSLEEAQALDGGATELSGGGASQEECSGYSVLGWILCPLATGFLSFIQNIFNGVILTHLVVEPLDDSPTADPANAAIFSIWNSFRIIANVLFVIVFLVAIFAQGLAGFQIFSAYDFRKILPRLVIGIVGIQLSWYIVGFMVDFFNIIGAGTRGLILAPVDGLQSLDFDFGAVGEFVGVLLAGVAVWIATYTLSVAGVLLLIPSILLPIALALIMALVVILFRKMLIFVLIVVSPIAFVLGVLPNTQVFFRQWWEYFWKALFMYPLIIAFIAAGELTAKVLVAGDESSATNQILGMIALFAPYFLITTTFRLAGSALAAAAGGLQNMGGGFKERVLGDARDPNSVRGRRRSEFQNKRRQSVTDFVDRHKEGSPTSFKRPLGGLRRGWNSQAKQRRLWGAGKTVPEKVPILGGKSISDKQWSFSNKGRLSGAVGGIVAGALVRTGMVDVEDRNAAANEAGFARAGKMADLDAGVLMAAIGMKTVPTGIPLYDDNNQLIKHDAKGNQIDPSDTEAYANGIIQYKDGDQLSSYHQAEAASFTRNISDITGAVHALLMWSRDSETHDQIRQAIASNTNWTDEQKDRIWGSATYESQLKALHPDLNSMDWRNGMVKNGKVVDFIEKTVARDTINSMLTKGENWYDMLADVRRKIPQDSTGLSSTDKLATARGFNALYDQFTSYSEQQLMFYYQEELKNEFVAFEDKDTGRTRVVRQDQVPAGNTNYNPATVSQLLGSNVRGDALSHIYDKIRTSEGTPTDADQAGYRTDKQILADQMRKAYPETFGGLAGRKRFMALEGMKFTPEQISALENEVRTGERANIT